MEQLTKYRALLAQAIMRKQSEISTLHRNHEKAISELDGLIARRQEIVNKMQYHQAS
jgi:hypothetical protein